MGTSNGKAMILSKCATCGHKRSRFIKNEEAKGLLNNLDFRTPLSNILFSEYKMNEIVNKFLLAADKFMPEMHLKQPRFTYST